MIKEIFLNIKGIERAFDTVNHNIFIKNYQLTISVCTVRTCVSTL